MPVAVHASATMIAEPKALCSAVGPGGRRRSMRVVSMRWTNLSENTRLIAGGMSATARIVRSASKNTPMSGTPVERHAAETSPQLTPMVGFGPWPKSALLRGGRGLSTMRPSARTAVPRATPSIIVFAVPWLNRVRPPIERRSFTASGRRATTWAARQSLGTTSNPQPGSSITPAALARASNPARLSNTSISPVMSQ